MNAWKKLALSLTFLTVSLIFFASRVQAQTVLTFNGIEINQGHAESDETYGWVCYGRTTGAIPGNFTMTLDYTHPTLLPGSENTLTGGTWTLPVYTQTMRGLTYMGVLYGRVNGGRVEWDKVGYIGTMYAQLEITGGSQTLLGSRGWVDAIITINRSPATIAIGPPTMNGTLTIYFW